MPRDVDISVGADNSALGAGLAEARNMVHTTMGQITREFDAVGQLSAGGVIAFFTSVIDKAHEIHHEAERFGIDAQQLQRIGNAAKEDGVQLQTVARAMNLAEINAYKATSGSKELASAFEELGINAQVFYSLSADEKMLALADAFAQSVDRGEAYANVAKIIGTRNTELIPTLEKGRAAILAQGEAVGVMSEESIARLEAAHAAFERFWNGVQTLAAPVLAWLMGVWKNEWELDKNVFFVFRDAVVGGWKEIERAMHLDFKGAADEWRKGLEQMEKDAVAAKDSMVNVLKAIAGKSEFATKPTPGTVTTSPDVFGATGEESGATGQSTADKLEEIEEKNREAALSDTERLNDLTAQRAGLQKELADYSERGLLDDQEQLDLKTQIEQLTSQILPLQQKINAAQDAYNQKVFEAREKAEDEIEDQMRRLQVLILERTGHSEIAKYLEQEWQYEDKINDLTDQINEAWSEGDQTLAEQLEKLRDMVKAQEALDRAAQAAQYIQSASTAGATMPDGGTSDGGGASDLKTGDPFGGGVNVALGLATNPATGAVDQSAFNQLSAEQMLRMLQGGNMGWLAEYAATQRIVQANANELAAQNTFNTAVKSQQESYLQNMMAGIPGYSWTGYSQIGQGALANSMMLPGQTPVGYYQTAKQNFLGGMTGGITAAGGLGDAKSLTPSGDPNVALQQSVTVQQAMLDKLSAIEERLGTIPGDF